MLVAKVLVNLFKSFSESSEKSSTTALFYLTERQNIIKHLNELSSSENKSFQIAFATLLLDYIVMIKKLASSSSRDGGVDTVVLNEVVIEFIQYFNELAGSCLLNWDSEAIFRVQVAYGTLVSKTDSCFDYELMKTVAKSLDGFKLACQEINAKAAKFPDKVHSSARFLLNEF